MHESLWLSRSAPASTYPILEDNVETDVVVIGAGITGASTALELRRLGYDIALIEARRVGESTTGYSTGNLYVPVQPFLLAAVGGVVMVTRELSAQTVATAIAVIRANVAVAGVVTSCVRLCVDVLSRRYTTLLRFAICTCACQRAVTCKNIACRRIRVYRGMGHSGPGSVADP